jgi:CDP-6-deoxy-D-xylo-4-hexulose-3-dehydrase
MDVAERYGLWVIEDACDALGSKYNGICLGSFGHIATFSFFPAHHITCGEGGAVVTNDALLKRIVESFRDWGRDCWCHTGHDNSCGKRFEQQFGTLPYGYDHKYVYSHIGYNLKITDMQAAVGVAQLKKLPSFIEARKKNFEFLYSGLIKYKDCFIFPSSFEGAEPCWFGFPLTVRRSAPFSRNDIVKYLEKNKIATRMLFSGNITRHPAFKDVDYRIYGTLENTDYIMENMFWIGVYPGLTEEVLAYILQKFEDFLEVYGKSDN